MKPAPQLDLFGPPELPPALASAVAAATARPATVLRGSALFSDCRRYRFLLERWWGPGPRALGILMNPSAAGADPADTDPTVTRFIERTRQGGASGFALMNVWPLIATDPDDLWQQPDAVRLGTNALVDGKFFNHDDLLRRTIAATQGVILVGWGSAPKRKADREAWLARTQRVLDIVRECERHAHCLGTNGDGSPKHPLYIGYGAELELYGDGFIR